MREIKYLKELVKLDRTVTNSKFPRKCGYFGKPAETHFYYAQFFIWAFVSQNKTKHKQTKISAEKEIGYRHFIVLVFLLTT